MRKGEKMSTEQKQKISKSLMGHIGYFAGKKLSDTHRKKISERTSGQKNHFWKCGKICSRGYYYIYSPNHPHKNIHNQVLEHRLVMEKHLGRYLTKNEAVHHIDGNPSNNKLSNLVLLTHSEHGTLHTPKGSMIGANA